MKNKRLILTTSFFVLAGVYAQADTLGGNGSLQSWSTTVLNTPTTGPYWNGNSSDGANYNIGWCLTGTGNCQISNPPGVLSYYGNGNLPASNMYFTGSGATQQVSLLGIFTTQTGVPPAGTDYFGWYSISNGTPGPLNPLFNSTEAVGTTAEFTPTSTYGFYFENVQSAGTSYTASYIWLLNESQSYATGTGIIDQGVQHFSIFSGPAGSYYLGTEDGFSASDLDYNDMIVELQPASVPEPAAATLIMCGIGLIGVSLRRGRRKN